MPRRPTHIAQTSNTGTNACGRLLRVDDGNRAIKMTGNATIDQNGVLQNTSDLNNITIYPNEYLTVTQAEYTKYYYAGGNRIASKIGTGGFGKMQRLCTLDQSLTYNANTLLNFVLYQIANVTNQPNDEYPVDVCAGYSVATELLTNPLPDFYISQTNLNFTQNNLLQQFRQNLAGVAEAVYYFHSDHLGSASWITSGTGGAVQHLLYLPFGEHFANEHSSGYDERFTFTGKERDAETGYYYHGARFNNSDIGWLSVDPMADKYPSISPYAYCAWNPVKLVDPDGRDWDLSSLTDEQKAIWEKTMTAACSRSKLFKFIYSKLDESSTVYSVKIGKTVDDGYGEQVKGQYNNKDKSITFSDEGSLTSFRIYAEEMIHAYQLNENKGNYGTGEFNYEFEAKFATHIIQNEGFPGPAVYRGMKNFLAQFDEKYNLGDAFTGKSINDTFLSTYKQAANAYAKYNRSNRFGNENYKTATVVNPYSLILMINSVRP